MARNVCLNCGYFLNCKYASEIKPSAIKCTSNNKKSIRRGRIFY